MDRYEKNKDLSLKPKSGRNPSTSEKEDKIIIDIAENQETTDSTKLQHQIKKRTINIRRVQLK